MKSSLVLCVVVSCVIGSALSNNIAKRLYKATKGNPGQFPYQALLVVTFLNGVQNYSGGVLIDKSYVLTAGRNCYNVSSVAAYLGISTYNDIFRTNVQTFKPPNIILHEKYDSKTLANNMCLLKMTTPVETSATLKPVDLPAQKDTNPSQYDLQTVTVSGWGASEKVKDLQNDVMYVNLQLLPSNLCKEKSLKIDANGGIGSAGGSVPKKGTDELCTFTYPYAGPCTGDVGDPMTIKKTGKDVLIGLVGKGEEACNYQPPAVPPPPVVYTYVAAYLDWIKNNMK